MTLAYATSAPAGNARSRCRVCVCADAGLTMVEVLVATLILSIGSVGLLSAFDAGRTSTSYSEEQNVANSIAEREILRITALPWAQIALKTPSTQWTAKSASTTDPTSYIKSAECDTSVTLPTHGGPCYQWEWNTSSDLEPLVISSEAESANADPYTFETFTAGKSKRLSGSVYRYITWVNDGNCKGTNNLCTVNYYKRITVAVTVEGLNKPVVLSTLYANPKGESLNPLYDGATCEEVQGKGESVPCTH